MSFKCEGCEDCLGYPAPQPEPKLLPVDLPRMLALTERMLLDLVEKGEVNADNPAALREAADKCVRRARLLLAAVDEVMTSEVLSEQE